MMGLNILPNLVEESQHLQMSPEEVPAPEGERARNQRPAAARAECVYDQDCGTQLDHSSTHAGVVYVYLFVCLLSASFLENCILVKLFVGFRKGFGPERFT